MPLKPIDYSKTIMYKIVCYDLNIKDVYVGHTTDFIRRKTCHKSGCNNSNDKGYNIKLYQFIRENGNWINWEMIKIEDYPCNTKLDATKRERELIETLNATLNSSIPTRTYKEYREDNKEYYKEYNKEYYDENKDKLKEYKKEYRIKNADKLKEYNKEYRIENADKIKEQMKEYKKEYYQENADKIKEKRNEYYQENADKIKEKVKCECGIFYTKNHRARHLITQKHQIIINFLKDKPEPYELE